MIEWAGFRFVNLPDDQARYYWALKQAHMVCVQIGDIVVAECKYADTDNGVVGDIVPLTEILFRSCDIARIRAIPATEAQLICVRYNDAEIGAMEDAIIKNGEHGPDQNDEGV